MMNALNYVLMSLHLIAPSQEYKNFIPLEHQKEMISGYGQKIKSALRSNDETGATVNAVIACAQCYVNSRGFSVNRPSDLHLLFRDVVDMLSIASDPTFSGQWQRMNPHCHMTTALKSELLHRKYVVSGPALALLYELLRKSPRERSFT